MTRTNKALLFHRFSTPTALEREAVGEPDEVSSVISEVTMLLNTRSPLPASSASKMMRRTVLEYGLVDFLHFSPSNRQDAQQLARLIRETVRAYEPRLCVDSVTVDAPRSCRDALSALISGFVRKRDSSLVPVSFPVKVGVAA